jgi:hypothetical protein
MDEDNGIWLQYSFVNEKGIELENRALSAFMTQNINQIDQWLTLVKLWILQFFSILSF